MAQQLKDQKNNANDKIEELKNEIKMLKSELISVKDGNNVIQIKYETKLQQIEELRQELSDKHAEIAKLKQSQGENEPQRDGGKTTEQWNDLVQKLREEKENQETQYEAEFVEFERMANEKIVKLEKYYIQQIQELKQQQLPQKDKEQIKLNEKEDKNEGKASDEQDKVKKQEEKDKVDRKDGRNEKVQELYANFEELKKIKGMLSTFILNTFYIVSFCIFCK